MTTTASRIRFASFEFDQDTMELWREGEPVPLAPKPAMALAVFLERAGSLITREELCALVWPDTIIEFDAGLNTLIRQLRRILGERAGERTFIETVPRRGYRFVAPIHPTEEAPGWHRARRRGSWRILAAAVAVGLAAVFAATTLTTDARRPIRLAIVPFETIAGDETDEWYANGLAEELMTSLARRDPEVLQVIGRLSTGRLAPGASIAELGDALRVDYMLEGSVMARPDGYRVMARLVSVETSAVVWAETLTPRPDDPAPTVRLLEGGILSSVAPGPLARGAPDRHDALPGEARVPWLVARHLIDLGDRESVEQGLGLLESVLRIAPRFSPARFAQAAAHLAAGRLEQAETALQSGFELSPRDPEGHLLRGRLRLRQWRLSEAGSDLESAVTGLAADPRTHRAYAYYLSVVGRAAEARAHMADATRLDPVSPAIQGDAGLFDYWAREPEVAARACEAQLAYALPAHRLIALRCLLHTNEAAGRLEQARGHALTILEEGGASRVVVAAVEREPDPERALRSYHEWGYRHLEVTQGSTTAFARAKAAASAGEIDDALRALEEAYAAGEPRLIEMAVEPRLDALRSDPRFDAIRRSVSE